MRIPAGQSGGITQGEQPNMKTFIFGRWQEGQEPGATAQCACPPAGPARLLGPKWCSLGRWCATPRSLQVIKSRTCSSAWTWPRGSSATLLPGRTSVCGTFPLEHEMSRRNASPGAGSVRQGPFQVRRRSELAAGRNRPLNFNRADISWVGTQAMSVIAWKAN